MCAFLLFQTFPEVSGFWGTSIGKILSTGIAWWVWHLNMASIALRNLQ